MRAVKGRRLVFVFSNLRASYFPWILAVAVVFILTAGGVIYWQSAETAEAATVEHYASQKLLLARAGAASISDFLAQQEFHLRLLSESEVIKKGTGEISGQEIGQIVEKLAALPLADIVGVDRQGKALWVANVKGLTEGTGISLEDRDYFIWAREQKQPGVVFLSEPVISRWGPEEGEWVVVMAVPVFNQNQFNGLVFISTRLRDLVQRFVVPLSLNKEERIYLLTAGGEIIATTDPRVLGAATPVLAWTDGSENDWHQLLARAARGEEGKGVFYQEEGGKKDKVVVSFAPVKVNNQFWSLWIVSSYDEVIKWLFPFRISQGQSLALGSIGILIFVSLFILGIQVARRDGFLDGFNDGRNGMAELEKKT